MGLEISSLLGEGLRLGDDYFELADAVAHTDRVTSVEGIPVRRWTEPTREPVHLWIDFSSPSGTKEMLEHVDTPVVIGTTGFSASDFRSIEAYAKRRPVLLSPNTSPGMNWMIRALREFPLRPEFGFEAVVEETHHAQKKDAPSGSAKRVLESLAQAGYPQPTVHVTRGGDVVGLHRVRFLGGGEEVVIEHRVSQRVVFAKGALMGAQFLLKQTEPRIYRMEEVLK